MVGGGLAAVGLTNFIRAVMLEGEADRYWMAFVGIPIASAGIKMVKSSFKVDRGTATYPVRQPAHSPEAATVQCPNCGATNPRTALFCESCEEPLGRACSNCGALNDADSTTCDSCARPLTT